LLMRFPLGGEPIPGLERQGGPGRRPCASRPPSLFKLIHGIVRRIDSLRPMRAQNMKSHAQTTESKHEK
jgi:hypothetical protein